MQLRTLGTLALQGSGFTRPKPLVMLSYLAIEGPQARRHLAELFWPDAADHMKSLTVALARLRRGAPGVVEADDRRVWTSVSCDAVELLELIAGGDAKGVETGYEGPFLEGVYLRGWSAELEEWVYGTRESLASRSREVLLEAAEREAAVGRFEAAAKCAERAYRLADPQVEPEMLERLHTILLAGGNRLAITVRREAEDFGLRLDLSPRNARERLHPAPSASRIPTPTNLVYPSTGFVGRERELEALTSMMRSPACRLLTLLGPAGVGKTRLSLQLARTLVGNADFADGVFTVALEPLDDPDLVGSTIVQALGLVETATRPAAAALADYLNKKQMLLVLDNFEQVVAAAPLVAELLAACTDLKILVTSRVALRLTMEHEYPVMPLKVPEPGGPRDATALLNSPAVALFVQRARAVKPEFELAEDQVRAVAEICIRLEGLPLAIELAAARVKLLSPEAMLGLLGNRLDLLKGGARDAPVRHQTLRQAIDWSYELLAEEEKAFFRRIAVCVGGCTLEAAAHLARAAGQLELDALDGLAALVDKSLIRLDERFAGRPRYAMLETIREYALERLTAEGERDVTERAHSDYYLDLARRAEPALTGPDQAGWLDLIEDEHDNFRAAMVWAGAQGRTEVGLELSAALWRFWVIRGHMREGQARLERFLSLPSGASAVRAAALNGLGTLLHELGEAAPARARLEQSLALWREVGDTRGIASALNSMAWVASMLGEFAVTCSLSEEAMVLNRELGEDRGVALSLNNLGWAAHYRGDFAAACSYHERGLALRAALGDLRGYAYAQTNLAWSMYRQGHHTGALERLDAALATVRELDDKQLTAWALLHRGAARWELEDVRGQGDLSESLALWREVGNRVGMACALVELARAWPGRGEFRQAEARLREALSLWRQCGHRWGVALTLCALGELTGALGERQRAAEYCHESLAVRRDLGDRFGMVGCLEALGELALSGGAWHRAAGLLAGAEFGREVIGAPLPPRVRARRQADLAMLRERLGGKEFDALWFSGRDLGLECAVAVELKADEA